jgi:hypothetical protein
MIGLGTKTKLLTKNLCSTIIPTSSKIAKLVNTNQIMDLRYLVFGSLVVESIMDGKSLDENKIKFIFSHPLAPFVFLLKQYPMKMNVKRD